MTETKNPPPGRLRAAGSENYDSSSTAKVIQLRPNLNRVAPFDALTARSIIAQHRAGTLPEGVIVALLAGVGLHP